jgi:dipeptidyl aminopeptidase/acylaminoacyl peptidase
VAPDFIASGPRFLYTVARSPKPESNGVFVGSLDGSPPVRVLPDQSNAVYVPPWKPARLGHLVFRREGSVMAQTFDVERLRMVGEMLPLAEQIGAMVGSVRGVGSTQGAFSASENGVVAFAAGNAASNVDMVWLDRAGQQLQSAGPPGVYEDFRLAADERRIVFSRSESSTSDIWVLDMLRGVTTRLTSDPAIDNLPIWSSDGLRVLFPSRRNGAFDLYIEAATGAAQEELLIKMGTQNGWGTDWSQDGRLILYQRPGAATGQDLWIAPQFGDRKPFPYLQSPFNEQNGVFSPDGHWIAYVSDESGHDEVYVRAFPLSGGKWPISAGGGSEPNWRHDGTELFYLAANRNLVTVPVKAGQATFEPGTPKALFPVPGNLSRRRSYAVGSTGQRFLVSRPVREVTATPITVVTNWQAALGK